MTSCEPGYYYHYKHDPSGPFNNYAYQVMGIGHHTEMKDSSESLMVVYRPLYEDAFVYVAGKHYDLRPLKMFLERVPKPTTDNFVDTMPRFTKIIDPVVIKLLDAQSAKMYS